MKYTVLIWEKHRIDWCKAHPTMLSHRQRKDAVLYPQSFGATPTYIFRRRTLSQAKQEGLFYAAPKFITQYISESMEGKRVSAGS